VYEVSTYCQGAAIKDLADGFNLFFKKHANHPKFHKKGINSSFRIEGCDVKTIGKTLCLPKKLNVKMSEELRFKDVIKICNVTVSKQAGEWYASILCVVPSPVKTTNGKAVGIDLGSRTIVFSDGQVITQPRNYTQAERKLRRLNKELARRKKGSANRTKTRLKLAKQHKHIQDKRKDFLHKTTHSLANSYEFIALEDLRVKDMLQNKYLAKNIQDASFYEFRRQVEYKVSKVSVVDNTFASSKICYVCGAKAKSMSISKRTWKCKTCGTLHDRDFNAACNILAEGLKLTNFKSSNFSGVVNNKFINQSANKQNAAGSVVSACGQFLTAGVDGHTSKDAYSSTSSRLNEAGSVRVSVLSPAKQRTGA
jgi:putative transposase